jgi:lipopolysaccharide export system permease protein
MKIIDRYLLRQFAQTFLICYLSLTGIYIVFDAFTNLEGFLHCAKGLELFKLMGWFYGCQSIFFFDRTSSLLVLMSAMFTVTWIQRHQEMTALMAAGVPRVRIVAPVLVAAAAVSLLAAVNRETVIPKFRAELSRRSTDPLGQGGEPFSTQRDCRTDTVMQGTTICSSEQRIDEPRFLLRGSLAKYGILLTAKSAYYMPPTGDQPGGYRLVGVLSPRNLANEPSLEFNGQPGIITPRDAPWLRPNECFFVSDVSFDQLKFSPFFSTAQLTTALRNGSLDYGADIRMTVHGRVVQPLLDITLLFLGLPLVVTRESRNVFIAIGLCLAVVTSFLLVVMAFRQLGVWYGHAALAAWAPLMIFVPAATYMAEPMWER